MTVLMALTKIIQCVTPVNATGTHSLDAKMANAFPNCGFVILMTIVVTTRMNLHIDVEIEIAVQAGRSVPLEIIIAASPVGYFVMERMIVVTIPMKPTLNIAPNAMILEILSARMGDAFHSDGDVVRFYLLIHF